MGFREDIRSLLRYLPPKESRQTLLFSATVPPTVKEMINECVRRDCTTYVDCIQEDDPNSHVVHTVAQSYTVIPSDKHVTGVARTILHLMNADPEHKILVFFPTTTQVAFFASLFNFGLRRPVLEIHSRKNQDVRTRTSDTFRRSTGGSVMFTSDVSARGVDYPDVTHVIQVGTASDRETYIHRLGRTGRAGKSGRGLLLLLPEELNWLDVDLRGIDIPRDAELQNLIDNETAELEAVMSEALQRAGFDLEKKAEQAYRGLLGYYVQSLRALRVPNFDHAVVNLVNSFSEQAGLRNLPATSPRMAKQLGLGGHPGLNLAEPQRRDDWNSGRGGSGDSRGGYGDRGGYSDRGGGGGGFGDSRGGYGGRRGGGGGYGGGGSRGGYVDRGGGGGYGESRGGFGNRGGGGSRGGFGGRGDNDNRSSRGGSAFDYGDDDTDNYTQVEGFGRKTGRGGRGGNGGW